MKGQPFVDARNIIVAGVSTGGWASLALSAIEPGTVRASINFAGGRGGHAYGEPNRVCGEDQLIASTAALGQTGRAPSIWFYAKNDSYFGPHLAEAMAKAWSDAGGSVEAHILPAYGDEGHNIADDRAGWDLWGGDLDRFLARLPHTDDAVAEQAQPSDAASTRPSQVPSATPVSAMPGELEGLR